MLRIFVFSITIKIISKFICVEFLFTLNTFCPIWFLLYSVICKSVKEIIILTNPILPLTFGSTEKCYRFL